MPTPASAAWTWPAARALPGVVAVVTGTEFNAACAAQLPLAGVLEHMKAVSRFPMAAEVPKYEGEPVAVVVAENAYVARDALELIEVGYEPLPAVVDLGAGPWRPDHPWCTRRWAPTSASTAPAHRRRPGLGRFAQADGILNLRVVEPRLVPNAMEPRAVTASYERGLGEITLWISTQGPGTWSARPSPACWASPKTRSGCFPATWAAASGPRSTPTRRP